MRSRLVVFALLAALSLALASCGQGSGSPPGLAGPERKAPSASGGSAAGGAGDSVIKVGAFMPITGPYADVGGQMKRATELAVKDLNSKGITIDGKAHQLQVIYYDTESKAEVALQMVTKALTVDKVVAATGFLHSDIFVRAMDEFQKYKVPAVTSCSASLAINKRTAKDKLDFIFQLSPTVDDIANAVAGATNHYLKPAKIALINENTDPGRDYGRLTREWYKKNAPGVEVTYDGYLTQGTTDYTAELTKVKGSGAQVLIGELFGASASSYMTQWSELKVPALTAHMGGSTAAQDFIDKHKQQMEGAIVNNRWWPGPFSEISEDVIARYKSAYGVDASNFAVQQYDATLVVGQAIALAKSADTTKIREAIASNTFTLVWGKKKFTPLDEGQRMPADMVVVQIQGGKKVPIWPLVMAEKQNGKFKAPPPWPWDK